MWRPNVYLINMNIDYYHARLIFGILVEVMTNAEVNCVLDHQSLPVRMVTR